MDLNESYSQCVWVWYKWQLKEIYLIDAVYLKLKIYVISLAVLTLFQKLFVLDSNQNSFHLFEKGLQGARNKRVET